MRRQGRWPAGRLPRYPVFLRPPLASQVGLSAGQCSGSGGSVISWPPGSGKLGTINQNSKKFRKQVPFSFTNVFDLLPFWHHIFSMHTKMSSYDPGRRIPWFRLTDPLIRIRKNYFRIRITSTGILWEPSLGFVKSQECLPSTFILLLNSNSV
jgi:hypothetical protein